MTIRVHNIINIVVIINLIRARDLLVWAGWLGGWLADWVAG